MIPIEIAELKKIEELACLARRKLPGGGLEYFDLDSLGDRQYIRKWLNIFAELCSHAATLDAHLSSYQMKLEGRP